MHSMNTASQATLISKSLRDELELATKTDHAITIRTLAEQTMRNGGLASFEIKSLSNKETFAIKNALVELLTVFGGKIRCKCE